MFFDVHFEESLRKFYGNGIHLFVRLLEVVFVHFDKHLMRISADGNNFVK